MRFHVRVPVRFSDLDVMGHVHHTIPLLYLEEARAAYWREVAGRQLIEEIDYVMGDVAVRYHHNIGYPGELDVAVRVSELGGKSFRMEFEIRAEDGTLLVSGATVQVLYDYGARASMAIPDDLRARITAYESGIAAH